MLDRLDRAQRLQLVKFLCSFAWADLEVREEERRFVTRMVERLDLDAEERAAVREWIAHPPAIDPTSVPAAHRVLFLEAVQGLIEADGEIAPEEAESLALLRELFAQPSG